MISGEGKTAVDLCCDEFIGPLQSTQLNLKITMTGLIQDQVIAAVQ